MEGDSSQFDFFAGESVLFCLPHGVRSATYPFHLISDGPVDGDTLPPGPWNSQRVEKCGQTGANLELVGVVLGEVSVSFFLHHVFAKCMY